MPPELTLRRKPAGTDCKIVWAEAGSITRHPRNWRTHDDRQKQAIQESIARHSWLRPFLYNATTGRLLDGHCRLDVVDPQEVVPVQVVELDVATEREVLLKLDPLSALAGRDEAILADLYAEVRPTVEDDSATAAVLDWLAAGEAADGEASADEPPPPAEPDVCCVIVPCRDEGHQKQVYQLLVKHGESPKMQSL